MELNLTTPLAADKPRAPSRYLEIRMILVERRWRSRVISAMLYCRLFDVMGFCTLSWFDGTQGAIMAPRDI